MDDQRIWCNVKAKFEPDGALRDVYVFHAGERAWDQFLSSLAGSGYSYAFTQDGQPQPPPRTFAEAEAEAIRQAASPLLQVLVRPDLVLNCHFFVVDQIELDLVPQNVSSFEHFENLLTFLRWLAVALRKDVSLTAENMPNLVILTVRPDGTAIAESDENA